MNITHVLFDLDNTLFKYRPAFESFILKCIRDHGGHLIRKEFDEIHQKNKDGYADRLQFFEWFLKKHNLPETPNSLFLKMKNDFGNHVIVNKNTKIMLGKIKDRYPIALLTNGSSKNQRHKLKASELLLFFDSDKIFISEEIIFSKPDPNAFLYVSDALNALPANILYVGDHWENDIVGGKKSGFKTCFLSYGNDIINPSLCDLSISSLEELVSKLPK